MRGAAEERERRRALLQLDRVVLGNRASILFSPTCACRESEWEVSSSPFHSEAISPLWTSTRARAERRVSIASNTTPEATPLCPASRLSFPNANDALPLALTFVASPAPYGAPLERQEQEARCRLGRRRLLVRRR
jgi:hypothetical protein